MSSSHYEQLRVVRENWFDRSGRLPDRCGIIVNLAGEQIDDIPSFYLALGEAVNGVGGYFGACLDSLDDCLCGGFGIRPPFTVRIRNSELARRAIDHNQEAWRKLYLEGCTIVDDIEYDADLRRTCCDESGSPSSTNSYWDALMQTFDRHNVKVVSDTAFG